jgi:redox-sensitive bicupin YhaK (pirin superfamily)
MNPSTSEAVHLLQIWIEPSAYSLAPSYAQKAFSEEGRANRWQLLVSPDAHDESLQIHQDATLRVTELDAGKQIKLALADNRHGYLHVAFGDVRVGDEHLASGDAITLSGPATLEIAANDKSQLLFFDLA